MNPKNQPESNLSSLSPYLLKEVDSGFSFETDFGVTYEIRFTDDSDYLFESSFINPVFSFSITHVAGQVQHKDPRVEQTIIKTLLLTFENLPDSVINYVCSLDDDKEAARNRLFDKWYSRLGQEAFIKLNHTNATNRVYSSVIFRRNHPAAAEIKNLFRQIFDK